VPVRTAKLNATNGETVTVGDVIQCSANTAYPPVSYYWQQYVNKSWQQLQQQDNDGDDGDDSSGSVLRLSTAGVYVLRCIAYNAVGNTTSDSVTLYVVQSGKYFKIFNYALMRNQCG